MSYIFSNIQSKLVAETIDANLVHTAKVRLIFKYSPAVRIERNLIEYVGSMPAITGCNLIDVYWGELVTYYATKYKGV